MPRIIVFRPGSVADPVQNSGFRIWQGHHVTRVNCFFFKNQNDVVLLKKQTKINGSCRVNQVIRSTSRVNRVTPSFFFFYFFFNPARFQPRNFDRLVWPDWILKLCLTILIVWLCVNKKIFYHIKILYDDDFIETLC